MIIIDILFPMYSNYKDNKIIRNKIKDFNLNALAIEGFAAVPLDVVKDKYQDSLNIKKQFEDKAKVNIAALTISISLMFGLSGLVSDIYSKLPSPAMLIVFFCIILAAFLYMLIAGMMSISIIVNNNEIYILDYSDLTKEDEKVKEAYQTASKLNDLKNLIRNNTIFSAYECIRNSIVCLLIIFIITIFPMKELYSTESIYEVDQLNGYAIAYNVDTYLPETLEFNDIQATLRNAINSKIIEDNESIIIRDKEQKYEIEIYCKDKSISILRINELSI